MFNHFFKVVTNCSGEICLGMLKISNLMRPKMFFDVGLKVEWVKKYNYLGVSSSNSCPSAKAAS